MFVLAGLAGMSAPAMAAEVSDVQVTHHGQVYSVSARLTLDVPRPAAFKAASSFSALAAHARLIRSSRIIGEHRLSSILSMCVLFYCKTVHQVVDYQLDSPKTIDMQVVPNAGDFQSGRAHWQFQSIAADKTRVLFHSTLVPKFWVPPLVGDWAIAHALKSEIADTGRAIETLARQAPEATASSATSTESADHGP